MQMAFTHNESSFINMGWWDRLLALWRSRRRAAGASASSSRRIRSTSWTLAWVGSDADFAAFQRARLFHHVITGGARTWPF
jgi:hypothetical protein